MNIRAMTADGERLFVALDNGTVFWTTVREGQAASWLKLPAVPDTNAAEDERMDSILSDITSGLVEERDEGGEKTFYIGDTQIGGFFSSKFSFARHFASLHERYLSHFSREAVRLPR